MQIDAHHHLWDLNAARSGVDYTWLLEDAVRFFGDPAPIRRDYLLDEFCKDAQAEGFEASVHIQVGVVDALAEARWVQRVADAVEGWPLRQVVFCDLAAADVVDRLAEFAALPSVAGVRQIVGRAPEEDAKTGTNDLLDNPAFLAGLQKAAEHGFSFDLQLIPELMPRMAQVLAQVPELPVALCHAGSPYDRTPEGLAQWGTHLRHLSALPKVVCKLSGLGMFDHGWTAEKFAPIVAQVLEQFGAERVMFGSNFPVDSLSSDYHTLMTAYRQLVPRAAHGQVFGATAQAFYFGE